MDRVVASRRNTAQQNMVIGFSLTVRRLVISACLVENSYPVEYEQPLFIIE